MAAGFSAAQGDCIGTTTAGAGVCWRRISLTRAGQTCCAAAAHTAACATARCDVARRHLASLARACDLTDAPRRKSTGRSEEHTSELQSLMRISYAVFCLKQKKTNN